MFKGFKEFGRTDWFGWGGASKLSDGSGPYIKEYYNLVIIVSGSDRPNEVIVNVEIEDECVYIAEFPTTLVAVAVLDYMTEALDKAFAKEGPIGMDLDIICGILESYGFTESI